MKIKIDLRKVLVACSAIVAMVFGSIFLVMYSNNKAAENASQTDLAAYNSFVITPDNMGKQGELMFAYIGKNNYLYNLDDESKPLIKQPASILLYASDDTVLYVAPAETDNDHYGRESIIQELQIGEHENNLYTIATVSIDPCWSSNDEVIYFIKDDSPKNLYTFEPLTSTTEMAAEFESNVVGLRISSDGLLVALDTGEEKLYVPLSKSLTEAYYNCHGSRVFVCEQYDLILTPSGELFYRWLGSKEAVKISDNVVTAKGYQDNEIFFIQNTEEGKTLNAYYVSEAVTKELVKLPGNIKPQITVSAEYAFLLDTNNVVYRYDIDVNQFNIFDIIEEDVKHPMISVFDYRLMVYDLSREMDQTFVYAKNATVTLLDSDISRIEAYKDEKESQNADVVFSDLEMGSIGAEVQELQNSLTTLGYLKTAPNGIFGVETTVAIQQLQFDLGLEQTGIADNELRNYIADNKIAAKEAFTPLSSTSKGVLVRDVQARLKTLGYRVDIVTGKMDKKTLCELQSFAEKNKYSYDGGVVKAELLDLLFDSKAVMNPTVVALKKGDCDIAVAKLNTRLKDLGYLAGSINPSYDAKTVEAIKLLCSVNANASALSDVELLNFIYGNEVVECPTNMCPKALDDTNSSNPGQVISDRQLKVIRKWLTKQFAVNHTDKQAVKRLQMRLVRMKYLSTDKVSMIYDKDTFDAVMNFQTAKGLPADGVVSKNTLTEIFAAEINRTIEMDEEEQNDE